MAETTFQTGTIYKMSELTDAQREEASKFLNGKESKGYYPFAEGTELYPCGTFEMKNGVAPNGKPAEWLVLHFSDKPNNGGTSYGISVRMFREGIASTDNGGAITLPSAYEKTTSLVDIFNEISKMPTDKPAFKVHGKNYTKKGNSYPSTWHGYIRIN